MSKQIHTHRAHCQLCAAVQAINVQTGIVAKHGYSVDNGYFNGVCPGSDKMNLHVERSFADSEVAAARAKASKYRNRADRFETKVDHPKFAWDGGFTYHIPLKPREEFARDSDYTAKWTPLEPRRRMVAWVDASYAYQEKARNEAIEALRRDAELATRYADTVEHWANRIHGKVDPYQKRDLEPREHAIGDTVSIGTGASKFSATIEAIEEQSYTTYGFRRGRGTVMCKHARVTRPAMEEKRASKKCGGYVIRDTRPEKVLWVALRDIKRAPNPVAVELKKAGLLR